jgi:hypothetical protein
MFNLDSLALKTDCVFVQLRHPENDEKLWADKDQKKPVGVHVYGTASKEYRAAVNAMQNRQLKRSGKPKAEVIREEGVELLVAVSERAENLEFQGKPITTPAQFRELYSDPRFSWVKDQIDAAVGDTAAFLAQ